jgi:hypothetical protein
MNSIIFLYVIGNFQGVVLIGCFKSMSVSLMLEFQFTNNPNVMIKALLIIDDCLYLKFG